MRTNAQRRLPLTATRPAYRTLGGWALGVLIEAGAIVECEHHGHRRDRCDPDAWSRARERAWSDPFPGTSPEVALAAIDEVLSSVGDTCPDCH
jgi:hypothetical protein